MTDTPKVGRELDAHVVEKVMGWTVAHYGIGGERVVGYSATYALYYETAGGEDPDGVRRTSLGGDDSYWSPSRRIADAWTLVEKLAAQGFWCVVKSPFVPGEPYHAGFTPHNTTGWNGRADHRGSGDSPALAICLAALDACAAADDCPPRLTRIVRHDTPYCEAHSRYYVRERHGEPMFCPVCRLERDEGLDLFNPEKTPSTESNNGRTTA